MAATRPSTLRSRRTLALVVGVALVATVALIAAALLLRSDDSSTASSTPGVDLEGIAQERTALGDPAAPVTLIEYADMQCPFCREYSELVFPTILEEYIRPGKVKAEFRGLAFLGPDSDKAIRFVLAAGLQDKLWQLQEALFRNQGAENSGWVTDDRVRLLAEEIPVLDVDRLFADAEGTAVQALKDEAEAFAAADDVRGTPSFYVKIGDAEPYGISVPLDPESFRAVLDDALDG